MSRWFWMRRGRCVTETGSTSHALQPRAYATAFVPDDRIAVVHFTEKVIKGLTVEHEEPNSRNVRRSIDRLEPGGSTNVQAGLDLAVQLADDARRERPDSHNYVILMSDGVANVDATNPFAILESAGDYNSTNPLRLINNRRRNRELQ